MDSGAKWGTEENKRWREEEGESRRIFRPLSLTPPRRHFFYLTFLCFFPTIWRPVTGYIRAFLHFQLFMVYIQLERRTLLALCYWSAGTDLVVLTFQLLFIGRRNSPFFSFLFSFFYFFSLSVSIVFFETYFSLLSPVSLTLPLPPPPSPPAFLLQTRRNDHSFCFRPFVRLFRVLGLHKK